MSSITSTLCCVCGDLAASNWNYGAMVCHSCRTFFRRTSMMVLNGKMKRALFCCLRGGNCIVDVNTRKKCNFCRFEKCKLNGMVRAMQCNVGNTEKITKKKIERKESTFEVFLTKKTSTAFVYLPKTLSLQFGAEEIGRLHFLQELFGLQKVVHPIGVPNIISFLECSVTRTPYLQSVLKTNTRIHEHWMSQFCFGLEEFQGLNPEEKKMVLEKVPLAVRLLKGIHLGPGTGTDLHSIIKHFTTDKAELKAMENYMTDRKFSINVTVDYERWRRSLLNTTPEYEQIHQSLNREIVIWAQKGTPILKGQCGLDRVLELLACILILFSQEHGGTFSKKIGHLYDCWRLCLWRYLDHQNLLQKAKTELYNGALSMLDITKQIWRIEQKCI